MAYFDKLITHLDKIDLNELASDAQRARVRDALFKALRTVQSPWDVVWEHNWVHGVTHACAKTFIDLGLFEKWMQCNNKTKTSAELAALVGAEESLIRRMMVHLAAQHLVIETAEDTFRLTPWAEGLGSNQKLTSVYGHFYSHFHNPMYLNLPTFLKERGYKTPIDPGDGNWQHWNHTENCFFQDLSSSPELSRGFYHTMDCYSKYGVVPWSDIYPTDSIVAAAKPDRVLIVDVGGGKGHALERFRLRHPDIPRGSLILQDLPDVVRDVEVNDVITVQGHDFFTEQPVKGAQTYLMHHVLHDWSDDEATVILGNIASAMEKGYSRLLLYDKLVTRVNATSNATTLDLTMMACLSAKERTEEDWHKLVSRAGLRILRIWRPLHSAEGVIEVEVA